MPNLYIIVPMLNEEGNIPRLIEDWKLLQHQMDDFICKFIIVDDGSTDATAIQLRDSIGMLDIKVISHEKNYGPGYAFGTGFEFIRSKMQSNDLVITIEGDNTSRVELIRLMIDRMHRENLDVVLASPYAFGGTIVNTSLHRVFLSHVANGLVKTMLGIHGIHTMSSFFRVYRAEVIQKLQQVYGDRIIERRGFECMIELLKKMILIGCTISEMPMKLDTSRRVGKSKMKIFRTIRGYLTLFLIKKKWDYGSKSL